MDNQEWLAGLAKGDKVVVSTRMGNSIGTVSNATTTRVTVNNMDFQRKTGKMVGASSMIPPRILPVG